MPTSPSSFSSSSSTSSGRTAGTAGRLRVAEEVFLIVHGLRGGGRFRYRDFLYAYDAVYGPRHWMGPRKRNGKKRRPDEYTGFSMTVGAMVRAQLYGGTIRRHPDGGYVFLSDRPSRPLYRGF